MDFKDTIFKHIIIEYECDRMLNEGILLEKHGLFDGAEEITDEIIKKADIEVKKGNNIFFTDDKTIWTAVKRIIYFLNHTEERAYVAMIKGVLKKNKHLYTPQQCFNEIKNNKPYLFYVDVEKYISELKGCNDLNLQKDIVKYFQEHGYNKIRTFNGLCNALDKRFFSIKEKMGKVTGKVIFDYIEDLKNNTTDWGIEF